MDADYFTSLEAVARAVRGSKQPFGGIQLILCGDFLQLPPVTDGEAPKNYCFQVSCLVGYCELRYVMQSPAWDRSVTKSTVLRQVHRQADVEFVKILNEVRIGR